MSNTFIYYDKIKWNGGTGSAGGETRRYFGAYEKNLDKFQKTNF